MISSSLCWNFFWFSCNKERN